MAGAPYWTEMSDPDDDKNRSKRPKLPSYSVPRCKLPRYNTIEDVCGLLNGAKKIVVLTGAGISVSAGIPDFRSRGGVYRRLKKKFGISDPEQVFDMSYFLSNPQMFYSFARELYPSDLHRTTVAHRFIALLEKRNQLLRNYSQNIDSLERKANITRLLQCHGCFDTASCVTCNFVVPGSSQLIRESIANCVIARCPQCETRKFPGAPVSFGVMKPDVVFFGQGLPAGFEEAVTHDINEADLLIVMGSSLKVHPVAGLISRFSPNVPAILINREVVGQPNQFDVELLGNCDIICEILCQKLQWELPTDGGLENGDKDLWYQRSRSNRYIFPGHRTSDGETDPASEPEVDGIDALGLGSELLSVSCLDEVQGQEDDPESFWDKTIKFPRQLEIRTRHSSGVAGDAADDGEIKSSPSAVALQTWSRREGSNDPTLCGVSAFDAGWISGNSQDSSDPIKDLILSFFVD